VADPAPGRWRALFFLSLAELGALSLWFSAAAVLPSLSREWQLGDGGRAGLTIAVQAGFIVGSLASALGNLPDIVSPRILMLWSAVAGAVLHVDRFGNLITSIAADAVEALGAEASIHIAGRRLPLVGTYAELPRGAAGALIGSSNRLEVAVREGSAAAVLKARRGTPVAVSRTTTAPTNRKSTRKGRRS